MYGIVCLCIVFAAFSHHQESPDLILGDRLLISKVVLSQWRQAVSLGAQPIIDLCGGRPVYRLDSLPHLIGHQIQVNIGRSGGRGTTREER
jgi:hypothetical protein